MRNYYIFIGILGAAVVAVIVAGLSIVGTPGTARNREMDSIRIQNFSAISQRVNTFYTINKYLPTQISEIKNSSASYGYSNISYQDPVTKKEYDYKVINSTSYSLCTTFAEKTAIVAGSLDSTAVNTNYGTMHGKGYDCIKYSVPKWQLTPSPIANYPVISVYEKTPSKPEINTTPTIIDETRTSTPFCIGTQKQGMCELKGCSFSYPFDKSIQGKAVIGANVYQDYCSGTGSQVIKNICIGDGTTSGGYTLSARAYSCPNGCNNGACLK